MGWSSSGTVTNSKVFSDGTPVKGEDWVWSLYRARDTETSEYRFIAEPIDTVEATCKEFDKVVMLMDSSFCYDAEGNLRNASALKADEFLSGDIDDFKVRKLFHGLSRAKRKVALVIKENEPVLDVVLFILQGKVR